MPNGKASMARRARSGTGLNDMEARMLKPSADDDDGDRPMDLNAPILSLRRSSPIQKQPSSVSFQQRPRSPFFAWEKQGHHQALALVPPPASIVLPPPPRSSLLKQQRQQPRQQQRLSPLYQDEETLGEESLDPPPSVLDTCIVSLDEEETSIEAGETTAVRQRILMKRFLAAARAVACEMVPVAAEPRPELSPGPSPCWKRSAVATPPRTFSDLIRQQEEEEEQAAEVIAERRSGGVCGFFSEVLGFGGGGCYRRPASPRVATRTWKKIEPEYAIAIQCRDLDEKDEEEEEDYEEDLRWRRASRFTPSRGTIRSPMIDQGMGFLGTPTSRRDSGLGSKSKEQQKQEQQMIRIREDDDGSENLEPLQLVDDKRLTISSSSFTFSSNSTGADLILYGFSDIEQRGRPSSSSSSSSDLREMLV